MPLHPQPALHPLLALHLQITLHPLLALHPQLALHLQLIEGATSRFANLKKPSLSFSSSSFEIRVYLLYP